MPSTGLHRGAGSILTGFDHVKQSIGIILATPIGSRVMRREFGSEILDLIDRPMTDQVILAIYAAAAGAIARWEPRYAVGNCRITRADAGGAVSIELTGTYFPRGHLGDFTPDPGEARVVLPIVMSVS